jgi:predicted glycoside hydrolase/deacetylase ChbG (UPF0249 family)
MTRDVARARGARAAIGLAALGLLAAVVPASPDTPKRTVQERLGHPAGARLLVIHADDLGMARSVNRATFEAFEQGWITSASVLVPCPWFPDVARFARTHPQADLGVHLALNSEWTGFRWGPLSPVDEVPSLLDEDGYLPLVEPTVVARAKIPEVERARRAQGARARAAGLRISHLDAHMGTLLRSAPLFAAYRRLGAELGLPILVDRASERPAGVSLSEADVLIDQVLSIGPGVAIADWPAAYERMLAPLGPGVYQLIVHLAYDDEEMRGATFDHPDWGAAWRQADRDLLKSARFRDFLRAQGFVLVSWADLAPARTN